MAIEAYIGELMLFAGERVPQGWMPADGRELPIAQNTALFSIIGARFGGDGRTSFALPDMRDSAPVKAGMVWCIAVQGVFPSF